jgi:hypothetical protein
VHEIAAARFSGADQIAIRVVTTGRKEEGCIAASVERLHLELCLQHPKAALYSRAKICEARLVAPLSEIGAAAGKISSDAVHRQTVGQRCEWINHEGLLVFA